jgi:hypothetical protein
MPDRYFIEDREEDRLHIFTGGKSDWKSLPEAQRNEIKRACLWSRTRNCWLSRAKAAGARTFLVPLLLELGFEDRGAEGDKLTFAEKVEQEQERAEARADRYEDRADRAASTAQAASTEGWKRLDAIPLGQPILVGHYSEQADRNYRKRACGLIEKAVAEREKAQHYADRAAAARATADGEKWRSPRYLGERIAETEAAIRQIGWRLEGKFYYDSEPRPLSDAERANYTAQLEEEQEKLSYLKFCLGTCGRQVFNRETLKDKKYVRIRGRWEEIVRLNPTTVAVPNICYHDEAAQRRWALKYRYTEIKEAK